MKLVIARNKLGFIGLNEDLPWGRTCPDDLKHFKAFTMGKRCLVGRKTFESLPPLKGREMIVVGKGYHSLEEALALAPEVVIGGKRLYESVAHLCTEFHISEINDETVGDTLFPNIDMSNGIEYKYHFDCKK